MWFGMSCCGLVSSSAYLLATYMDGWLDWLLWQRVQMYLAVRFHTARAGACAPILCTERCKYLVQWLCCVVHTPNFCFYHVCTYVCRAW
ncbi:hypothetical protein BKA81DRAFT_349377 [Phyllosticta paracitricarpa]